MEEAIVRGQDLAVFNLDAPLVAGRDGENVGLDGPCAHILQQGRVAQLAHNLVVDGAGLVGVQDFGLDGLAVDPHGELGYRRAFRQREEIGAFHHPVVVVDEELVDVGGGHLVLDGDVYALVGDGQAGRGELVGRADEAGWGGFLGRRRAGQGQNEDE